MSKRAKKTEERKTYAVADLGQMSIVMELGANGVEFSAAPPAIIKNAMRLGVHCLNSGLSESEIVELLTDLTNEGPSA